MEINKEIYDYISNELGFLLMSKQSLNQIFWHMWQKINYLLINKRIDVLDNSILINKLSMFIDYIEKG